MYPESYAVEAQEWLDKYGYVEVTSFPNDSASAGVIGPTPVAVGRST